MNYIETFASLPLIWKIALIIVIIALWFFKYRWSQSRKLKRSITIENEKSIWTLKFSYKNSKDEYWDNYYAIKDINKNYLGCDFYLVSLKQVDKVSFDIIVNSIIDGVENVYCRVEWNSWNILYISKIEWVIQSLEEFLGTNWIKYNKIEKLWKDWILAYEAFKEFFSY